MKIPKGRQIPEKQGQIEAAKDRIEKAVKFFERHFDEDGYPKSRHGLTLHYRYSGVPYYSVKNFRVFKESYRKESEACGTDHPQGSRLILTVEYVSPHSRGEGGDEGSL